MGTLLKSIIIFFAIQCGYKQMPQKESISFSRKLSLCITDISGYYGRNDIAYCSSLCDISECASDCYSERDEIYRKACISRLSKELP